MPDKSESMCVIANFAEFLTKCLQNRVSEFSLESLEKRGGHFGSVLLLAHVKLSRSDESEVNTLMKINLLIFLILIILIDSICRSDSYS